MALINTLTDLVISIHAPHEGERLFDGGFISFADVISIHAPHEGERLIRYKAMVQANIFQSTLPTRGSDTLHCAAESFSTISIHAPHEGERLKTTIFSPV